MNTFNANEILSAAPDMVALAFGNKANKPHPLASEISLKNIAYVMGEKVRARQSYENDMTVMARGMGTNDFAKLLADGAQQATIAAFEGQADYSAFTSVIDVKDFQPSEIPAMDNDLSLQPLGELAEIQRGFAFAATGGATVSLTTYARAVSISRQLIFNDQIGALTTIFKTIGTNGARLEARLVAEALEANANLDDGQPVFAAEFGNLLASDLATGLGAGIAALRTQLTSAGERADLRARHLVVEPVLEYTARNLVLNSGLDVTVTTLANLPTGRWFLMADPKVCPTVCTLRLNGAKTPVRVEQKRRDFGFDGAQVKVTADVGASLLRRVGIVRGGA